MYLGAMSTRDWKGEYLHIIYIYISILLPNQEDTKKSFLFLFSKYIKLLFTCLADGVMPIWTTMIARVIFSSCILWQYILIVLIPTLGSSEM